MKANTKEGELHTSEDMVKVLLQGSRDRFAVFPLGFEGLPEPRPKSDILKDEGGGVNTSKESFSDFLAFTPLRRNVNFAEANHAKLGT